MQRIRERKKRNMILRLLAWATGQTGESLTSQKKGAQEEEHDEVTGVGEFYLGYANLSASRS